jgi:hypothetical protein
MRATRSTSPQGPQRSHREQLIKRQPTSASRLSIPRMSVMASPDRYADHDDAYARSQPGRCAVSMGLGPPSRPPACASSLRHATPTALPRKSSCVASKYSRSLRQRPKTVPGGDDITEAANRDDEAATVAGLNDSARDSLSVSHRDRPSTADWRLGPAKALMSCGAAPSRPLQTAPHAASPCPLRPRGRSPRPRLTNLLNNKLKRPH